MKIGAITNAYKEERLIKGCIEQFKGFEIDHIVLNTSKPWGQSESEEDNTPLIAIEAGAKVYTAPWQTEEDQFNWGLDGMYDKDWVLIVDADERYEAKDIELLLENLSELSENIESVKPTFWEVYWKTPEYRIIPEQPFKPIIAVRPHVRFTEKRQANCSYTMIPITLHHFSYVRNNEEMLRKINSFSHKDEIVDKWYENVWLNWKPRNKFLHPVIPSQFQQAIYDPAPEYIKELTLYA
jgi:glycosyltransferase involved in cell wall biosynthesis